MEEYNQKVQEYLESLRRQGIEKIIAFSGGADEAFEGRVRKVVEQSMHEFRGLPIAVLTGGTKWGLPKYASEVARNYSFPVIGIYPQRGLKHAIANLDFAIEVSPRYAGSEWGDESELYAKLANGVEIIGGGAGTLIELAHVLKMNEARKKDNKGPVYISPVRLEGVRTTADIAYDFSLKASPGEIFPLVELIEDVVNAAKFLIEKLGLDNQNYR